MDQEQAKKLIKNTFESAFDKNRFTFFIKNLLNSIDESKSFHIRGYVKESFKNFIKTYERIGTYKSPDGKTIDIIIVYLQKDFSIHHARVTQRNFAGKYLSDRGEKDAGFFAYVGPDETDWRFSLVTMDYSFKETANGKHKVITEFSPARRWSFLVGENEKSHTAQKQLISLLADDVNNPTLAQLIEAFNIEKVSNEFFLEYRNLFIRTKEELDKIVKNDPRVKSEFTLKGVNTVDFAKKLLGQIVFLYFLQKKGWFGVARDDNWGAGSKKFLRELFEKKHSNYNNFFNDILEPLFYEALRNDRSYDSHFYSRFNCKIPFLNGGLFDPIGNYDWVNTDICLPDHLFSNSFLSKQGDIGNGILDIFDRYNFTVREDEPLEKEVAIDPELLGKAYEKFNAIRPDNFEEYQEVLKSGKKGNENKFNKQYGVYYTPREIVHYMCQQSLIHYLENELNGKTVSYERVGKPNLDMFGNEIRKGQLDITIEHKDHLTIPKEDIETFIQLGEQYRENDEIALQKEEQINNGNQNSTITKALLPESIRKNALLIDEKLANITVCDPAVGSGAFPVGMMNEIVKARNVLTPYIKEDSRTIYGFKRQCIEKSLYGVDIDPGAVEIAKLRLWLSLIVEEEDFKNIKPLPNLDYKIVQGNSLISEFMEINLDADLEFGKYNKLIIHDESEKFYETLQIKKEDLINQTNITEKRKLKKEIEDLITHIFEISLRQQKTDYFKKLDEIEDKYKNHPVREEREIAIKREKNLLFQKTGLNIDKLEEQFRQYISSSQIRPFFSWRLYFSEIFLEKDGFDIVIANPPYLKERENKRVFEAVNRTSWGKRWHQGKMDYWYFFLHKGIDLTHRKSIISFITSRYWLNSTGARKIIKRIHDELIFVNFVDIGKVKVFDEVAGQHMIATYSKDKKCECFIYKKLNNNINDIFNKEESENLKIEKLSNKKIFSDNWEILLHSSKEYDNTVRLGSICDISQGVVEAIDKVSKKTLENKHIEGVSIGDGVFVLTKNELDKLNLNELEKDTIKRYLDPNDVYKWNINKKANKFLIFSDKYVKNKIKEDKNYSNLKRHLDKFRKVITSSNAPYGLHRPRQIKYFNRMKIIFKNMFATPEFTYDEEKYFFGFSFSSIIERDKNFDLKYILALLNSSFALSWYKRNCKKRGIGFDVGVQKIRNFPIKKITNNEQIPFIELVNKIFNITKTDDYLENIEKQAKVREYEEQIDQLIYKLYELTPEEIKIVEGK